MGCGDTLPYSGKTLRFKTSAVEAAFVQSRYEQLYKSVLLGSALLFFFVAGSIVTTATLDQGSWSGSQEGTQLFRVRVCLMGFICVAIVVLFGLLTLSPSNSCIRSGANLETLFSAAACLVSLLVVAMHPWNLARVMSINDPYMFVITDDKLLLDLDVWLTALHFLLPMRFPFLVVINLVTFTGYCTSLVLLGCQKGDIGYVMNMATLLGLILAVLWGKRSLEILERTTFVRIAQERTLRYEAEHKLSTQARSKERSRDHDSASVGTSLFTAEMFDLRAEENIDEKLEGIIECGAKEHWIIEPEELRPVDDGFISNGGFGMVLLAHYHGVEVAVKLPRISSNDGRSFKTLKAIASELRIFRRLHHPNIVAFHGACIDLASTNIALVIEYVRGMPLRTASSGVPTTPVAMSERLLWTDNICAALVYLHAQKPSIVHSDIKDTNVLVEQTGTRRKAKLLDFGLSKLLTSQNLRIGGTLPWMAPEAILRGKNSATTKLDVFSFGRLFYKIMTGRAPLEDMRAAEIKALARGGSCPVLHWPSSMLLLPEFASLCDACSLWDPGGRPDMIDVKARLRALCSGDDVPEEVKDALREAFPHRSCSLNLRSVFAKVQSEGCTKQNCMLWHDKFVETPSRSRILSIRSATCRWNTRIQNSCCILHARLRALEEVVSGLRATACQDLSIVYDSQCRTCGLMNDGKCYVCNRLDQAAGSAREKHARFTSVHEDSLLEEGASVKVEQHVQPLRTLLHDAFAETPLRTRILSITLASLKWNISIDGSCCVEHARRSALENVVQAMQTTTCSNHQTVFELQCQSCGALSDGDCILCDDLDEKSKAESQEHAQTVSREASLPDYVFGDISLRRMAL